MAYDLLCVAHPDDETIFFGGLLQVRRARPWTVICITNGNADGEGRKRRRQFERACALLGVRETQWWNYPDIYEKRLPVEEISARLLTLPKPHSVFSHGIIGEYGHPHHQDVSYAVHQAFETHPRLFAHAYNAVPVLGIRLSTKEFELKARLMTDVYGTETSRFLNLLPATAFEGYLRLGAREVEAIYNFFAHRKSLRASDLKTYRWLAPFLKTQRNMKRPF